MTLSFSGCRGFLEVWERKKYIKKKHVNRMFTGLSRDLGGGGCRFVYVFFSPIRNGPKKHINKFLPPAQSRDNPSNFCVYVFFLSLKVSNFANLALSTFPGIGPMADGVLP